MSTDDPAAPDPSRRRFPWTAYAIAVATSLAALAVGLAFHRPLSELSPFIVFYAAVAISSWCGGFGPGMVAMLFGAVACDYYLLAPRFSFGNKDLAGTFRLGLFVAVGTLIARLSGQLLAANADARAYQRRLAELSSELVEAEGRERRRIASVLHDSIGQSLALAKLQLQSVAASGAVGGATADALAEVERSIGDVIQQTRSLTSELSPPVLFELGLVPALRWLAERVTARHGLRVDVMADAADAPPVPEKSAVVLFEIASELLRNVVKHARAGHAIVRLHQDAGAVRLTVSDDGVGFDPKQTRTAAGSHEGFGLFSVRERCRRAGGKFAISAQAGEGTSVTIDLPAAAPGPPAEPDEGAPHARRRRRATDRPGFGPDPHPAGG